eukprot:4417608-Prorocentrum_lima.AAC.1
MAIGNWHSYGDASGEGDYGGQAEPQQEDEGGNKKPDPIAGSTLLILIPTGDVETPTQAPPKLTNSEDE